MRLHDAADRAARQSTAELEAEALTAILDLLPASCLVLHTAGRGAGVLTNTACHRRNMQQAAWPLPSIAPDRIDRDAAIVDALVGLRSCGWLVKALVASTSEAGAVLDAQDALTYALRQRGVAVRIVRPDDAPSLHEEPDDPPDMEEPSD